MSNQGQTLSLRPVDAAKSLGISPRTLWAWTQEGIIPHVKVGTGKRQLTLYSVASLQRWLDDQAKGSCGNGGEA
ncbi:helix-turn-helix domain-containing protein [Planctomicrobium sp. SH668]|uniref:helix-turn-helix domain-containing protein n=1 Tax=Planctomicrobium sp. SH668 TaxID=3448126 RepID=UPI003F5C7BD2